MNFPKVVFTTTLVCATLVYYKKYLYMVPKYGDLVGFE
jgi:hypothetical protein